MISENTLSQAGNEIIPEKNREVIPSIDSHHVDVIQRRQFCRIAALGFTAASIDEALGGSGNRNEIAEDKVDLIEINHFHDDQGRPVFDQIIFYDWSDQDSHYHVRDWRLLKNGNQIPLKSEKEGGNYITIWSDFKNRDVIRKTTSKILRETWTKYDPELMERDFLPEGKRRKLTEIPVVKKPEQPQPLTPVQNPIRWFRNAPVPAPAPAPAAEHGR